MDVAKRFYKDLTLPFVFIYLAVFPLGQLLKVPIGFFGQIIDINFSDLIVFVFIPIYFASDYIKPKIINYIYDFILVCIFSLIFSLNYFTLFEVLLGALYLVRFIAYTSFFAVLWNLVRERKLSRSLILDSLLLVVVITAILGWIQYILIPNLTFLKFLNWDDHLYRLVGTFLDPAFTALTIVFGIVIALVKEFKHLWIKYLLSAFLIVSLVFTYSRASYLALAAGIFMLIYISRKKYMKLVVLTAIILVVSFLVLPRKASEGTYLERTQSIFAKGNNYKETMQIIIKNPVFGVGFNNLCIVRLTEFGGKPDSHACSGSDSSLLMVLATTGIIGFLIFAKMAIQILLSVKKDEFGLIFLACCSALFVHSLFVQSAFYAYIMGFMGLLYSPCTEEDD